MKKLRYILVLVMMLSGFAGVYAQTEGELIYIDYYSPKEYEVGDIIVTGADHLDHTSVILLSGISVGEKIMIPSDKFSTAIDKLWKQGIFEDIHIYITKVKGRTIFLEYALKTKPRLSSFRFEGVSRSEGDKIKEKLGIAMGDVVTDNLKTNCTNIIHDYFADKGYYNAKTEIIEKRDTNSARKESQLTFKIDKGKKVRIGKIQINGNEYLSDSKIRRQMKNTKEFRWWRIWKSSRLIEDEYKADKKLVIEKYNNEGFRDAAITWDTTYVRSTDSKRDEIVINMNIYEGKKYFFRDITWVGNTKYSSKELSDRLRINKGDAYNKELLTRNVNYDPTGKDISSLYMDDGYLFFRVIPTEINIENDSIDIEMRIYEGTQARIGKVDITGNTTTNDFVIRRELKTIPGQLFSRDDVMRSIREIQQLGYFNNEKINPKIDPNIQSGTVDITYELMEENSGNQVSFSGGWGGGMLLLQGGLVLTLHAKFLTAVHGDRSL